MNFKLVIGLCAVLFNCSITIKTQIIINSTPNNILRCAGKIHKTLTIKKALLVSKIDENLNDFYTMQTSNSLVTYTKESLNELDIFDPFHLFIILIKSVDQYEQLINKISKTTFWDARAKFIVGYFGNEDIGPIFNTSLNKFVYNINVVKQVNEETNVYTFFPYQDKICGKYENYGKLASCEDERNNFYPNKIPLLLHGCEVNIS